MMTTWQRGREACNARIEAVANPAKDGIVGARDASGQMAGNNARDNRGGAK